MLSFFVSLRHAYERDPAAVEHWLEVGYPQLRQQAKKEGATIWWEDEMGMRSDHQTGRSYTFEAIRRYCQGRANGFAAT